MDSKEFTAVLADFNDHFGNCYRDRDFNRIFELAEALSVEEFKAELEKLMDAHQIRRPPSVHDIRTAIQDKAVRAWNINEKTILVKLADENEKAGKRRLCIFCDHTGIVDVYAPWLGGSGVYSMRCTECKAADIIRLSKAYIPWHEGRRSTTNGEELVAVIPDIEARGSRVNPDSDGSNTDSERKRRFSGIVKQLARELSLESNLKYQNRIDGVGDKKRDYYLKVAQLKNQIATDEPSEKKMRHSEEDKKMRHSEDDFNFEF